MSLSHRGKETGAQRDDCLSSIRLHCSGREWILHYSRSQSSHLQDGVASLHPVALAWNQNDVLYFIKVASQVALEVKNPPASADDIRDVGLIPGLGRFPWRRAWQPTPVFLPGESLWSEEPGGLWSTGCKESDMTEWLSTLQILSSFLLFHKSYKHLSH